MQVFCGVSHLSAIKRKKTIHITLNWRHSIDSGAMLTSTPPIYSTDFYAGSIKQKTRLNPNSTWSLKRQLTTRIRIIKNLPQNVLFEALHEVKKDFEDNSTDIHTKILLQTFLSNITSRGLSQSWNSPSEGIIIKNEEQNKQH